MDSVTASALVVVASFTAWFGSYSPDGGADNGVAALLGRPAAADGRALGRFLGIMLRALGPVPVWLFGVIWPLLFALNATATALYAIRAPPNVHTLWLLGANVLANRAWAPVYFRARMPWLALLVLQATLVLACLALAAFVREPHHGGDVNWSVWLWAPYVAWLGFAMLLNLRHVYYDWLLRARERATAAVLT